MGRVGGLLGREHSVTKCTEAQENKAHSGEKIGELTAPYLTNFLGVIRMIPSDEATLENCFFEWHSNT